MTIKILASNAAWSAATHVLGRGSLVLASIILANQLELLDFAKYSNFQLTASLFGAYAAMGLGITATKFYAEAAHTPGTNPPIRLLWYLSAIASVAAAAAVAFIPQTWLSGDIGIPWWATSLGVFSVAIGVIPAGGVIGLERYLESTAVAFISAAILVIGSIAIPFHGSATPSMLLFISAMLVHAIGNSIIVRNSLKRKGISLSRRISKEDWRTVLKFAGPMLIVGFVAPSGSWIIGRLLLNQPNGALHFSQYSIGLQWYGLALFLPGMISRVLLPKLVQSQSGQNGSTSILVRRGVYLASFLAAFIAIAGSIASPLLSQAYDDKLELNAPLFVAFMFSAIPSAPANTIGNAIVAANGQLQWLWLSMLWLAISVLLALLLVDQGAIGGAAVHAIASAAHTLGAIVTARKRGLI